MKFECKKEHKLGDCVAYLTPYNSLIVKDEYDCIYLDGDGSGHVGTWEWNPDEEAARKFYPGDTITITFT